MSAIVSESVHWYILYLRMWSSVDQSLRYLRSDVRDPLAPGRARLTRVSMRPCVLSLPLYVYGRVQLSSCQGTQTRTAGRLDTNVSSFGPIAI